MSYETTEAKTIFVKAHLQLDPASHYKDREVAAHELLDAIETTAKTTGYSVSKPSYGVRTITHMFHGSVSAVVEDDRFFLYVEGPPARRITDELGIEYDPVTKGFVGREQDKFNAPTPGAPSKKRSAVAVVAEQIVALIAEQSEAKRRAR
ncbi:MAG: hypothetical protein IPM54_10425 [Polyangiaceae bacterium]|nr:hypothetical protein [Polyangiaceae bacterium]